MSLNITSYDPDELKRSLIDFVQTKPEFSDINYEGSAFNTIIDLLVRNTHYIAYMANMTATESFLDSAQLRASVVSHAQKLSYIPKSQTASTCVVSLKVTPAKPQTSFILTCVRGSSFIATVGNDTYTFTNTNDVTLVKDPIDGNFYADNVELKQGNLIRKKFAYSTSSRKIDIPHTTIDTSTLRMWVSDSLTSVDAAEYAVATSIIDVDVDSTVYYLSESSLGTYTVEFGKNILGKEPTDQSVIELSFVSVEKNSANGLKNLIAATPIEGHSNITVTVTTEAYGGAERDSIERMKFLAPRVYEAQNRAVRDTDYETIMIREFPFIKSAKAWGGERNNPPYYGRIFLCAIPEAGFVIADSVKTIIENKISEYAVTGITPEIVDAEYIGLRLNVGVLFNETQNSETFNQVSTRLQSAITQYDDEFLRTFDFWYNNSLLVSKIQQDVPSVYSVEIDKTAFIEFQTKVGLQSRYEFDFVNEIRKGTLLIKDAIFDTNASNQLMYDDGLGNIVMSYDKGGVNKSVNVGKIDYITGSLNFSVMILNDAELEVTVELEDDNFYTRRNKVVYIDNSVVSLLDDRRL